MHPFLNRKSRSGDLHVNTLLHIRRPCLGLQTTSLLWFLETRIEPRLEITKIGKHAFLPFFGSFDRSPKRFKAK